MSSMAFFAFFQPEGESPALCNYEKIAPHGKQILTGSGAPTDMAYQLLRNYLLNHLLWLNYMFNGKKAASCGYGYF
jgi:hypothetical protein